MVSELHNIVDLWILRHSNSEIFGRAVSQSFSRCVAVNGNWIVVLHSAVDRELIVIHARR